MNSLLKRQIRKKLSDELKNHPEIQDFLTAIDGSTFKFIRELKGEFTFLIPAGLAFYILAEIFEKGKQVKEENDLTI